MTVEFGRQACERIARVIDDECGNAIPATGCTHRDRAARDCVGDEASSVGVRAGNRDKELAGLHLAGVERNARYLPFIPRKRDAERAGERAQAHRRPPRVCEMLALLTLRLIAPLLTLTPGIIK